MARACSLCLFSLGLTCGWLSAALAQEDAFDLGVLVLRGELQDRILQDSATSAAVETGEELDQRGDPNLDTLIERTPGVTLSGARVGLSIRGVSQSGLAVGGNGLLISTQVDGAALPNAFATIFGADSTWDLGQVEVLRGPQSPQQGRNALAGAIIVRSADPEFFPEYRLRAEIGQRNFFRFALMANQPLIEDRLALRFAFEHQESDGYVFNPVLGDDRFDAQRMITKRVKLRWQVTDSVEAIVSFSHTNNRAGEDFVRAASFPAARINRSGQPSGEGAQHDNTGLRINWDINDVWRLESETTLYEVDYFRLEDFDQSPLNLGFTNNTFRPESFEQDIQLKFDTGRISGVVGVFYTEITDQRNSLSTTDLGFITGGAPNGILLNNQNISHTSTENFALFGEVDIPAEGLLPGLTFTLGARYDFESFRSRSLSTTVGFPVPPTRTANSGDFDAFLPKAGARYAFSDDQSVAFTIQRSYRAGGVSDNSFAAATPGAVATLEFDPEFTTNYEVAYRGSFYDGTLRLSANAFYARWTDQQVTQQGRVSGDPNNTLDRDVVNAGESEYYGAELTIEGEPTANLSLYGSVAHVETRFLDFIINRGSAGQQILNGNEFPSAPNLTAAIGGKYSWNNGVTFGVDASYQAADFANIQNTLKEGERFLVNAQVTYETQSGWLTGLYVRNLFDRDYTTVSSSVNLGPEAVPANLFDDTGITPTVRTGEPRTIGIFAQKTF